MIQVKVHKKENCRHYGMYKQISLILHVMSVQIHDRIFNKVLNTIYVYRMYISSLHTCSAQRNITSAHSAIVIKGH